MGTSAVAQFRSLPKRSQMVPLRDQVVDLLLILSGQLLANER